MTAEMFLDSLYRRLRASGDPRAADIAATVYEPLRDIDQVAIERLARLLGWEDRDRRAE